MSRSVPSAKVTVSCRLPSAGRLAVHIEHVLDAVDLLLERRRDGIADDFGGSAGIAGGDDDRRRRDLRILSDRQGEIGRRRRSMMTKTDRTVAKIGRSTKKCDRFMRRLSGSRSSAPSRSVPGCGVTLAPGRARTSPLMMTRSLASRPERMMRRPSSVIGPGRTTFGSTVPSSFTVITSLRD